MGYISLRNPKTDIKEFLNVLSKINQHTKEKNKDTFTYEEVDQITVLDGTITSKGNFGTKAISASNDKNKSKDSIKMQLKSLSEIFRVFGWIIKIGNSHTFKITEYGKEILDEYDKYPQSNHYLDDLIIPFLLTNYSHPQIDTNIDFNFFPYLTIIKIINELNYITKWEIIHFINTNIKDSEKQIINKIIKARSEEKYYSNYVDSELSKADISPTTADNYNKIPMALFISFGLLEKKSLKSLGITNLKELIIEGKKAQENTKVLVLTEKSRQYLKVLKDINLLTYQDEIKSSIKGIGVTSALNYLKIINGLKIDIKNHSTSNLAFPYHVLNENKIAKFESAIKKLKAKNDLESIFLSNKIKSQNYIYDLNEFNEISISLESSAIEKTKKVSIGCLQCKPLICYEYSAKELLLEKQENNSIPDLNPYLVCPTKAIGIENSGFLYIEYEKCIDCLICVSRCPYGAIYYKDKKLIIDNETSKDNLTKKSVSESEAVEYFNSLKIKTNYEQSSEEFLLSIVNNFYYKSMTLKQDSFYPLIRNFLRSLGVKTKVGKGGDTAWRYDAIALEPFVMPIEIKSPTEDKKINPNSVRQAIENAINVEAQHNLTKKAKSAVVGVHYSNERSASKDMLSNANELHNIKILLISSVILMYLNMKKLYNKIILDDIVFLFENTIGSFDTKAIKEFWLNYLVRREEVEALAEKAKYNHEITYDKNDFKTKLTKEVEFFEKVFELIQAKK